MRFRRERLKKSIITIQEERTAYFLLIPAFLGLIFITYLPLTSVFGISLFRWTGLNYPQFIGLQNFFRLFTEDPYFWDSIKVTLYYSILSVLGGMIYSLFVALLLNTNVPFRGFLRSVFYLPYILPAIGVYIGWSWLYEYNFGLINYLLISVGFDKLRFLSDSSLVVPSITVISVWTSGNLIVVFLAGLQNVPRVYYEAAMVDGANSLQRFLHITIPCMTPIIFYNLLISLITNMQIVVPALALTNGGPGNASMFMSFLMYRYAFINNQMGYACSITFVFFIIIGVFTSILFYSSKSWIFYEGDSR